MLHHHDATASEGTPTLMSPAPAPGRRMSASAVLWVTLAVFAQEAVWNFYDAQVPEQLRQYVTSAGVIGLIMGLDHSLGSSHSRPWGSSPTGSYAARRDGGRSC